MKIVYEAWAENHDKPFLGDSVNELIYREMADPTLDDLDLDQTTLLKLLSAALADESRDRSV